MRIVFLLAILLSCQGVVRAQQQERKLMDRLLNPDSTQAYQLDKGSFDTGKGAFGVGEAAFTKGYYVPEKVQMKAFSSKAFNGSKNFWAGDFKYTDSALPKERFVLSDASKTYQTNTVDVKNARESGQSVPVSKYADNGPFRGRDDDQTALATNPKAKAKNWQQEQQAAKTPLTIDQVRDLLNKSN